MKNFTLILSILFCFLISIQDTLAQTQTELEEPYTQSDWFRVRHIDTVTFSLEEPQSSQENVSYLLLGDEKAIMFDTGSGENDTSNSTKVKHILDSLTGLSTTLLLSHFHFDHNQNIAEFKHVTFPDIPFLRHSVSSDNIYKFTAEDLFLGDYPSQVQVDEWFPLNTDINLGNRIIQLINIPGHTPESIAIIDKTNKLVFLGDFMYNGALFLFHNNDLKTYEESVGLLISKINDDYRLFGAHGTPEIEYEKLQLLKNFLVCIKNNKCQSKEKVYWGRDVLVYKHENLDLVIFQ